MSKKGFTLIEILVGITILLIIGTFTSNFFSENYRNNLKLENFGNQIISQIEKVRNDDLIGKGITNPTLVNPESWVININSNGQGYIRTNYIISGTTEIPLEEILFQNGYNIDRIRCKRPNGDTEPLNNTQIGKIIFEKGKYRIGGDCISNSTEIIIDISYKNGKIEITFDSINGLLKKVILNS